MVKARENLKEAQMSYLLYLIGRNLELSMITLADRGTTDKFSSKLSIILILRSLSNSGSADGRESRDQKKGNIRKERAKKLKGITSRESTPDRTYHFCQYCM